MICVAIAAKNANETRKKAKKAIELGADLIEIRLDYFNSIILTELHELVKFIQKPVILTLRKPSEGGNFQRPESERIDTLRKIIETRPAYVDVEINTQNFEDLIQLGNKNSVKIIGSYHDFEKTPGLEVLLDKITSIRRKGGKIAKLITTATSQKDNIVLFNLLNQINDIDLIAFAMGSKGITTRVLSPKFGALFTFASVEEQTAPGQIHISKMKEILKLMEL